MESWYNVETSGAGPETLAKDLQLGEDGDLLVENGDLVLSSGLTAIAQDAQSRLLLFEGEYYLDLDRGVPWLRVVFVKRPSLNIARAVVRSTLEATPGVRALEKLDVRQVEDELLIDWHASSDFGELGPVTTRLGV